MEPATESRGSIKFKETANSFAGFREIYGNFKGINLSNNKKLSNERPIKEIGVRI